MIGICYLTAERRQEGFRKSPRPLPSTAAWTGPSGRKPCTPRGKCPCPPGWSREGQVVEINTYEQLRELDGDSDQLQNDAIGTICRVFDASPRDITHITVLKRA